MGLHDSLLDVPERLRIWQSAGIRYLYLEEQADAATPPAAEVPASRPSPLAAPATAPSTDDAAPAFPPPPHTASVAAPPAAAPTPSPLPGEAAATEVSPSLPQVPALPGQWPEPWPAIFRKSPPRPRLVITYEELGLDMTGRADPRRGALWRELIKALGLAGTGAVGFWPHGLPESTDADRDMAIFLAGLHLLRPATLAFFGTPPGQIPASLESAVPGCELVILADAPTLAGGDREAFSHAIARLDGR